MKTALMDPIVDSLSKTDVCIITTSPMTSPGKESRRGGRAGGRRGSSSSPRGGSSSSPRSRSSLANIILASRFLGSRFLGSRASRTGRTSSVKTALDASTGNTTGAISNIQGRGRRQGRVWTRGNLVGVWTRGSRARVSTRGRIDGMTTPLRPGRVGSGPVATGS